MTKRIILFLLFTCALLLTACKSEPWVVKVDGEPLTLEEFENYYYASHMTMYDATREEIDNYAQDPQKVQANPYLNRQKFLETFVRQHLLEKKIDQEKLLEGDKEYEALLFLQELSLTVARYSKLKFEGRFSVTPEEMEQEYAAHKEQYANLPANQIERLIQQKLMYDKYQALTDETISKLKSKRKIERNEDVIQKLLDFNIENDPAKAVLFTIDGDYKVTTEDFNNFYYAMHMPLYNLTREEINKIAQTELAQRQTPTLQKNLFLNMFIDQKILYDEALNGEFKLKDDKELSYSIKIQQTITKINYYVRKKYSKELEPTNAEYERVFEQNKDRFPPGATANQIEAALKPRILQEKLQQKGEELIENAKEKSMIEYNNKVLNRIEENEEE